MCLVVMLTVPLRLLLVGFGNKAAIKPSSYPNKSDDFFLKLCFYTKTRIERGFSTQCGVLKHLRGLFRVQMQILLPMWAGWRWSRRGTFHCLFLKKTWFCLSCLGNLGQKNRSTFSTWNNGCTGEPEAGSNWECGAPFAQCFPKTRGRSAFQLYGGQRDSFSTNNPQNDEWERCWSAALLRTEATEP